MIKYAYASIGIITHFIGKITNIKDKTITQVTGNKIYKTMIKYRERWFLF